MAALRVEGAQRLLAAGDHQIAPEQQPGAAGGDPHRLDVVRTGGDPQVAHHRTALLGEAGHVEHRGPLALEMGRHAEERADRDHAGAADPADHDAVALVQRRQRRLGQLLEGGIVLRRGPAPAQLGAFDRDEARAEALEAGIVLVAGRLVDLALAPELGLDRHDRDAVGGDPAVAAALAHHLVDHHPARRVGHLAALAPAALLGGAGLVVDQDRGALDLAQLALDEVELVPMVDRDAGGEARVQRVLRRLVGDHDHPAGALGRDLAGDLRHREWPIDALAAGHRDRVVVEDLEGDVDAGRDRRPDREQARVVVGAVADVLEDVAAPGERRLADPVGAFAAHLGVAHGRAVHPLRHVVAADAGLGDRALGHPGRAVVGAAGAEVGRAQQGSRRLRLGALAELQPLELRREGLVAVEPEDALGDRRGDLVAGERAVGGEQRPLLLVALADDPRRAGHPVEQLLELALDQRALLLDHDDLLEAGGEGAHGRRLERPDQAELQDPKTEPSRLLRADAELVQRLAEVEPGLAGRDDAEPRRRGVEEQAVEPVAAGERARRVELESPDYRFPRQVGAAVCRFRGPCRRSRISGAREIALAVAEALVGNPSHPRLFRDRQPRAVQPRPWSKVAVLSLLVHVLTVVIAWCVVQSIEAPVVFGQIFQLVPPVMLITMLPISIAGWGVREATMGLAFGYAGLIANEGVNISLLFGAVSFHCRRDRRRGLDFQRRKGSAGNGADRGSQIALTVAFTVASRHLHVGSNGQFAITADVCRGCRGGIAVGRHDIGDPAAASAGRTRKAERKIFASHSDPAGRRASPWSRPHWSVAVSIALVGTGDARIPFAVFGATLFIAAVGFADDVRSIPVLPRLLLQAVAVAVVILAAPETCGSFRHVHSGSNARCCCLRVCGS